MAMRWRLSDPLKAIALIALAAACVSTVTRYYLPDARNPRFGANVCALEILFGQPAHERVGGIVLHQINRRAAKAASRQTRSVTPGEPLRNIHQHVEFTGAVLEIVARTGVALEQILAELVNIAFPQRTLAVGDAMVFTDDVQRALIFTDGQLRLGRFELIKTNVA